MTRSESSVSPTHLFAECQEAIEQLTDMVWWTRLKRAGLDYWPFVAVKVYESWQVGHALAAS